MFYHEIDTELRDLVFSFFYKFSRFEFALKENDYAKPRGRNVVSPDWKLFREQYEGTYILSSEASDLLENAPLMQVIVNKKLSFITELHADGDSELRMVVRSVHRIRNNLFHGGKHGSGSEGDVQRNKYLLGIGCIVLDQLSLLDANIGFDYPGIY